MNPVIEIQHLHKIYSHGKKEFAAVRDISFFVEKGEIFGILGPNGAGKSTTLEIIEGLKQQTEGEVKVLGFDNIQDSLEIKKRIGVQLQSSEYLPYVTLGELLDLFASLYPSPAAPIPEFRSQQSSSGISGIHNKTEARPGLSTALGRDGRQRLLALVGLQDKEHELVKNLSGGQKQRFTIATSLVNRPEILFLDEPTTGLDPKARRDLWQLIKKINEEGITVILTTHFMEEAEFLCNRVAIMDQGKILTINEPRKLIEDLSHTTQVSFFTIEPVDQTLFSSLPEVEKVYSQFPKTIIEIKSLQHINTILDTLKQHKISFSGFTVKTASLEDVYLDLTGKEFTE